MNDRDKGAGPSLREAQQTHPRLERISTVTAITVIVSVAVFLYLVRAILLPFVLGAIVAFVCTPLIDALAARTRWPRWIFALAVLAVLLGAVALAAYLGAPHLVREISHVSGDLQGMLTRLLHGLMGNRHITLMGNSLDAAQITAHAVDALHEWLMQNGRLFNLLALGFAGAFGLLLTFVILGYCLIDAPRLAHGLLWLAPPRHRPFVQEVWVRLRPNLRRYFIGVALVVVYAATAAYVGLGMVLGIHGAVFLAVLTGMLEVIPLVGPAASAVIAGLVAMQQATSPWAILGYVVYAIALRVSIDQFFGPIVLGRAASVRPVLVIFCFLTGGVLFGVVGVILAVPVALAIKVILATLYDEPPSAAR